MKKLLLLCVASTMIFSRTFGMEEGRPHGGHHYGRGFERRGEGMKTRFEEMRIEIHTLREELAVIKNAITDQIEHVTDVPTKTVFETILRYFAKQQEIDQKRQEGHGYMRHHEEAGRE